MPHFNFIASQEFSLQNFNNISKSVDSYPDFQTVVLSDNTELTTLLELLGIDNIQVQAINSLKFSKYWDISSYKLPEYYSNDFDQFYQKWLMKTRRENKMNEYGCLFFLQELSAKWNKLNYRLIVLEK